MKLLVIKECFVVGNLHDHHVKMMPGDTIDIAQDHAEAAIVRGLVEPYLSSDDAETGAPPRQKAAVRGAPERK